MNLVEPVTSTCRLYQWSEEAYKIIVFFGMFYLQSYPLRNKKPQMHLYLISGSRLEDWALPCLTAEHRQEPSISKAFFCTWANLAGKELNEFLLPFIPCLPDMWLKETASGILCDPRQILLQADDVFTSPIAFPMAGNQGPTVRRDGTAQGSLPAHRLVPWTWDVNCDMNL